MSIKPISADSHVVEGPAVFAGLADRFGDEAPRIMNVGDQVDAIVIPARGMRGVSVARMGMAATRLNRNAPLQRKPGHKPDVANMSDPEIVALFARGYAGMRAGLRDGAHRHEDQDVDGLEAEVLYPGFFAMFGFSNVDLLVACQRNYNDWLHDYASAAKGRLIGLAAIPIQDPQAAVAELDRVIRMGYRGGCIPCTSPAERPYFDAAYEPVWARAEEAAFPISMHTGCLSYVPEAYRNRALQRRDAIADYAGSQHAVQRTIVELMCRGVAERHPRLQFVVAEFNAGWIAHWLDRVDQGQQRERRERPDAVPGPSPHEVWRRQFWATIEDDKPALLTADLINGDHLMWGSDYPHTDSTWPFSVPVLDELFAAMPSADRAKVTRDNVRALYRI